MHAFGNFVPRCRKVFCTASSKLFPSKANVRARTCRSLKSLHAAVGDPPFDHRFEFLGDDRLPGIGEQARAGNLSSVR
jgi:hypothetical protein